MSHTRWFREGGALLVAGVLALGGMAGPVVSPAAASSQSQDVVFLLDGSGSIDAQDWDLQLRGYAAALQDPVNFPLDGTFSVSIVQWAYRSAATSTRVEIPLTNLDSRAALDSVVAAVNDIDQIGSSTNPGDGIRTGTNELIQNGRDDARWTLCMSTDRARNAGEALSTATAYAQASSVDKYTVVAIEDGSFNAAAAARA